MAKFKTGLNTTRNVDQMRNVEVEIDFTSNALASILYRQGETVVLACCTKEARLPGCSHVIPTRDGFMPNTRFFQVQPIHTFVANR